VGEALGYRHDDAPFQLWDDLGCSSLHGFHPISSAIYEVHWKRDQKREGVVHLADLRLVGPGPGKSA
jgi:hypothetical protein